MNGVVQVLIWQGQGFECFVLSLRSGRFAVQLRKGPQWLSVELCNTQDAAARIAEQLRVQYLERDS